MEWHVFSFEKLEDTAEGRVISMNHYEEMREMIDTAIQRNRFLSLSCVAR